MNIGERDQVIEAIKDLAFVTKEHYDRLVAAGFGPHQAMQLAIAFQRDLICK